MELQAGQTLSHYRLVTKIGEGGMGVVWKAVDTRLDRPVALKFLPENLAADPERQERFYREARLLASLSHGNIATLHEIAQDAARPYLVMEFVDGHSLRQRLVDGALPVAQALELAGQIAGALAAAHERAVVHRDLKPDNVVITAAGQAKLLDFGLAKHFRPDAAVSPDSDADTAEGVGTRVGAVMGTPEYMSPEQARGETVDRRTDVWSFGCLLYEMLTGKRAFAATSAAELMVAILERPPDLRALPASTPPAVRRLVARCLEKEVDRRETDMARIRSELGAAAAAGKGGATGRRPWPWVAAAALATAVLATAFLTGRSPPVPEPAVPDLEQLTFARGVERFPAWSPDGRELAYCREHDGLRKIFVRDLESGVERRLTSGDADDIQPFWWPDGRGLVFVRARQPGRKLQPGDVFGEYDDADVWRLDLDTGEEIRLVEGAAHPAVSPDGSRIAVGAEWASNHRIWLVDELGRNPRQLTTRGSEDAVHVRPRWSPGGDRIVFQSMQRTRFDIALVDVATGTETLLTDDPFPDYTPVFSPDGRTVYFSSYRSAGINVWRLPVGDDGRPAGRPRQVTTGAGQDVDLAMSGAGRLAFTTLAQNADIWKLPVSPDGTPAGEPVPVVATTREDSRAAVSPDGSLLAFNSDRSGTMNIWVKDLSTGGEGAVTEGPGGDFQPTWFPDSRALAFFSTRAGSADVWKVDLDSGELTQLTSDPAYDVDPVVSPDGSRIAFHSDRGGRMEVWVMDADGGNQKPVTRTGATGHFIRWTHDGRRVLFRSPGGPADRPARLVSIDDGAMEILPPVVGGSHMSFSPDGTRILDVSGHQVLWVSPLDGGAPHDVFRFADPGMRIDYPRWSPDGRWVYLDRFRPEGGDIWAVSTGG